MAEIEFYSHRGKLHVLVSGKRVIDSNLPGIKKVVREREELKVFLDKGYVRFNKVDMGCEISDDRAIDSVVFYSEISRYVDKIRKGINEVYFDCVEKVVGGVENKMGGIELREGSLAQRVERNSGYDIFDRFLNNVGLELRDNCLVFGVKKSRRGRVYVEYSLSSYHINNEYY